MVIALIIFLILFILIDLLFYIPIIIHIYISQNCFGIYIFSIPIFYVSHAKTKNLLKHKISIEKLKNADPINIKYIESIAIDRIQVNAIFIDRMAEKALFIYPILGILKSLDENIFNQKLIIEKNLKKEYYFYLKMQIKIARIVKYYFIIRRLKSERTSNKRNFKKFDDSTR